jgi:Zn-dependent protease with chaperone function
MPSPALFLSLLVPTSFLYSYGLMRLSLRPWERVQDQHWTERARWLWLARKTRTGVVMSVISLALISHHEWAGGAPSYGMVLFCALGGYLTAQFFIDRRILPGFTPRLWRSHMAGMLMATSAWVGVIVWVALSMGEHLESIDGLRLGVAAVLLLLIFSGIWLLALPGLHKNPHTPRLRQMVDEMTAAAGVRPVRAFALDGIIANAFALMYIRCIMVTVPAMKVLRDDELRTLIKHELAHLSESWSVLSTRMLGGLSWLGIAFTRPMVHQFDAIGVLWIFLAVFLVRKFAAITSRRMENRADSMSVTHEAEGPVYARALEKLYEVNQFPAVMAKRHSHPDLYDRMLTAGLTPEYPRPAPPPPRHWTFFATLLPVAIWLGSIWAAKS